MELVFLYFILFYVSLARREMIYSRRRLRDASDFYFFFPHQRCISPQEFRVGGRSWTRPISWTSFQRPPSLFFFLYPDELLNAHNDADDDLFTFGSINEEKSWRLLIGGWTFLLPQSGSHDPEEYLPKGQWHHFFFFSDKGAHAPWAACSRARLPINWTAHLEWPMGVEA